MSATLLQKKEAINKIIDNIFMLDNPRIDESRRQIITDFVVGAVNGDEPISDLVLNANLNDNIKGVIVYILTNLRLVKIDIDIKEIQSNSFFLNTIIGIERKIIDDYEQFSISFQNGSFGLRYSLKDHNITKFFQQIDQVRSRS
jgi:hypothetical protein